MMTKITPRIFASEVRMKKRSIARKIRASPLLGCLLRFRLVAFVLRRLVRPRRLRDLHHLRSEVANFAQAQSVELRNRAAHLAKDFLDRVNAILAGAFLDQITQDFPIIPRQTRWKDRAIQTLEASLAVDHRSAFLSKAGRGEQGGRAVC